MKFFIKIINKTKNPQFKIPKKPFTHYNLLTKNLINKFQYKQTFNITTNTPIQYNNTYISLKNLTISITYSNNISNITITKPIYIKNNYYSKINLFKQKYSIPNKSLPISTTTNIYIYNKINIHYLKHNIKYN